MCGNPVQKLPGHNWDLTKVILFSGSSTCSHPGIVRNHSRESQIIVNQWIRLWHSDMVWHGRLQEFFPPGRLVALKPSCRQTKDRAIVLSWSMVDGRCWSMCHGHGNHMWSLVIVDPTRGASKNPIPPAPTCGDWKRQRRSRHRSKSLGTTQKKVEAYEVFITMSGKKNMETVAKLPLQNFHLIGNFHAGQTIRDSWSTLPATYPGFPLDTIGILSVTMGHGSQDHIHQEKSLPVGHCGFYILFSNILRRILGTSLESLDSRSNNNWDLTWEDLTDNVGTLGSSQESLPADSWAPRASNLEWWASHFFRLERGLVVFFRKSLIGSSIMCVLSNTWRSCFSDDGPLYTVAKARPIQTHCNTGYLEKMLIDGPVLFFSGSIPGRSGGLHRPSSSSLQLPSWCQPQDALNHPGNMWKHHPLQRTRLISGSFLAKFMHSCKMFGKTCQMKCCSLKFRERGLLFERKSQVLKAWHFPISFQIFSGRYGFRNPLDVDHWSLKEQLKWSRDKAIAGWKSPLSDRSPDGDRIAYTTYGWKNDGNVHLDGFAYHLHWSWASPL